MLLPWGGGGLGGGGGVAGGTTPGGGGGGGGGRGVELLRALTPAGRCPLHPPPPGVGEDPGQVIADRDVHDREHQDDNAGQCHSGHGDGSTPPAVGANAGPGSRTSRPWA